MKIVYFASKNKYGYTKRQLKIDYDKKTYKVGSFVVRADKIITNKLISEKIEELKLLGFKEEI